VFQGNRYSDHEAQQAINIVINQQFHRFVIVTLEALNQPVFGPGLHDAR
jgi:hypothetical protein